MLEIREPKTFRQIQDIFGNEFTDDGVRKMLYNLKVRKGLIKHDISYSLTDLGTKKLNEHIDKILNKL
jgi:predicted transcriptional regulator